MKTANMRAYMARYYNEHREELRERARQQYQERQKDKKKKEARAAYGRAWRAAHPDYKRKYRERKATDAPKRKLEICSVRGRNGRKGGNRYQFPPGDEWVRLDFETLWNLCDADHAEYCRRWCIAHPIKISELVKMRRAAALG